MGARDERSVSQCALACLALLVCCGVARAQPTAAVDAIRLELAGCEGVSGARVRELVALEVAPRAVLDPASEDPAATHARLSCQAEVALIEVAERARGTPLRLEISLGELASSARPRSLALAVAELIATSRLQQPKPAPAAEGETPREPPRTAAVASEPTRVGAQLWLAAGAARVAQPSMIGPLGALGVVVYWDSLALSADLRVEHARMTRDAADFVLDAGSLALAPAWRMHASELSLMVGAGLRVGLANLRGSPRSPALAGESIHGFWLAPCLQLSAQVRIVHRWALRLGVEGAYVTRALSGLDASGAPALELRGLSLAAHLGLGFDM